MLHRFPIALKSIFFSFETKSHPLNASFSHLSLS
jgi:hypothetical protein